jgi:hypothetical protein
MHSEDPSSRAEDQFAIDVSAFHVETVPHSSIKLLRPRAEAEPELSRQLDIRRRLELLRRHASPKPHPHTPHTTSPLEDVPSDASHFVQDVAPIGETSRGETVYLAISALVEPSRWKGGWFLAIVSPQDSEGFQTYLAGAREAIVAQLQLRA